MNDKKQSVKDEANRVIVTFKNQVTNDQFTLVDVIGPEANSADWTLKIQKSSGPIYDFRWAWSGNEEERRKQLERFLLRAKSDNLLSGNYEGKDYLS